MPTDNKPGQEQRTLLVMRKLLSAIVRETTPKPGMKHILSDHTREDIRLCFSLISARELELSRQAGVTVKERPRYADEPRQATVVAIESRKKPAPPSDTGK